VWNLVYHIKKNNKDWRFSRIGCLRKTFGPKNGEVAGYWRKTVIMRRFTISHLHKIFGWSNRRGNGVGGGVWHV
jgi:hypothetical protein